MLGHLPVKDTYTNNVRHKLYTNNLVQIISTTNLICIKILNKRVNEIVNDSPI